MLSRWGMDDQAWRLDDTVHPFALGLSESDIRLTTRFDLDNLGGILSCLHEFGHGVYERQVDARYFRTPLQEGTSSSFHESQSRLWENIVGRRLSTWRFFYPRLQETFPEQLAAVPLEEFHRALNRVAPGVIRVDADEVTYSLHIVLRFELERELLAGTVTPADLPEAFIAKLGEYLGVEPASFVEGVLQDVHWSDSNFGYFPTYALGNVISVQLWERATGELGDLDAEFERGEFALAPRVAAGARPSLGSCFRAGGAAPARSRRTAGRGAVPRLPPREGRGARAGVVLGPLRCARLAS